MSKHIEPVTGGLVTSRVPDLLSEGDLTNCANFVYTVDYDGLTRKPARGDVFSAVVATGTAYGMVGASFQNGQAYLITEAQGTGTVGAVVGMHEVTNTAYGTAGTPNSTSYSYGTSTTVGTFLAMAMYQNKVYLFDGTNRNLVYPNGTPRLHGMLAVTAEPATFTATGSWSASATGYFDYWYTEAIETGEFSESNPLESTFEGKPQGALVTATSIGVNIALPETPRNSGATHYYIYRSEVKPTRDSKVFPSGRRIGRLPISSTASGIPWNQYMDGSYSAYPVSGTTNAIAVGSQYFIPATTAATAVTGGSWDNASGNVTSNNGAVYIFNGTAVVSFGTLTLSGFFGADPTTLTIQEPIGGIQIGVECWNDTLGRGNAYIQLSGDGGSSWSAAKQIVRSSTSGATFVVPYPAEADDWGIVWTAAKLNDTNFRVRISTSTILSDNINFDWVGARVTYNGSPTQGIVAFPAVIIDEGGGTTSGVGANGQPPTASTGDVFEGSLVTDDSTVRNRVRWSVPTKPEYFPSLYRDDLPGVGTVITNIKTFNNRLVVCTNTSKWRYNYLPTQLDAQFSPGKVREAISEQNGCINPQCATTVQDADGRTLLVVAGYNGIFATDGYSDVDWTQNFAWRQTFNALNWSTIRPMLINNPQLWELTFLFRANATTMRALKLNYHPRHLRDGLPKLTGLHTYTNVSSGSNGMSSAGAVLRLSSGNHASYYLYNTGNADSDNRIFCESSIYIVGDSGVYPQTNSVELCSLTTRRMYLAGFTEEFMFGDVYVLRPNHTAVPLNITPTLISTNNTELSQTTEQLAVNVLAPIGRVNFKGQGEALQLTVSQPTDEAGSFGLEALVVDWDDLGSEDSGS